MQLHGPKRVYTRDSLEFWFGKLEQDWDGYFSAEHLEAGRELYRTGGIREVELNGGDAVVHCRVEKRDEYSVLEWSGAGLHVRSSSPDRGIANTIAVAGLHEIEELVADEIVGLPETSLLRAPERVERGNGPRNGGGAAGSEGGSAGSGARGAPTNGGKPAAAGGGKPAPGNGGGDAASARARRELVLEVRVTSEGLICEPWWVPESGPRVRALAPGGKNGGNGHGNGHGQAPGPAASSGAAERMKLISLTALARKSHFHFHPKLGVYRLESMAEIPHFLKTVLPGWARTFRIEREPAVERLERGVQTVRAEARVRARGAGNAIDLEWIFRAGEQLVDAAAIERLAAARGGPVVVPSIGMVALAPEHVQALEQWRETAGAFRHGELPAYLLFSLFDDRRFQLALAPELEAWRHALADPRPRSFALPGFMRPYQRRGVEWLANLCDFGCHGLLADEMGLGKTMQAAALIAVRPVEGRANLVVCPASVVPVWREELARFFPAEQAAVLRNGHDFARLKGPRLWIASYAQLRNHRALLEAHEFGYAVLDEGQFIKNPDAKVTATCLAIRARHRIVLTGTPLENRQLDLWSIVAFLLPGLLGTRAAFEAALARNREATMEALRRQLAPFILRRTKAQVAQELPPKVEMDLFCPLTDVQRLEYARVCREGIERLGDDIDTAMREKAFGFLSLLTRLRQVCCDPDLLPWLHADTSASGKLGLLVERLGEIVSNGHKVVVFSQFVTFLERAHAVLQRHFPEVPRYELTGATIDRQRPVQEFQNREGAAFMLVSLKAAGTGITLHSADYVFLLDPWWNPAVEEQAIDRVHRIGQTRTVFVYRMVTQGTIEERIQALKEEKRQIFRQIVDGVSGDIDLGEHFRSLRELVELAGEAADAADNGDAAPDGSPPVPI